MTLDLDTMVLHYPLSKEWGLDTLSGVPVKFWLLLVTPLSRNNFYSVPSRYLLTFPPKETCLDPKAKVEWRSSFVSLGRGFGSGHPCRGGRERPDRCTGCVTPSVSPVHGLSVTLPLFFDPYRLVSRRGPPCPLSYTGRQHPISTHWEPWVTSGVISTFLWTDPYESYFRTGSPVVRTHFFCG